MGHYSEYKICQMSWFGRRKGYYNDARLMTARRQRRSPKIVPLNEKMIMGVRVAENRTTKRTNDYT